MQALFDPARHEPLSARWSEVEARAAIERIARVAIAAFSPEDLWASHPLDEAPTPQRRYASLYEGAGGVILALRHLAQGGFIDAALLPPFDATVATLVERNRAWEDFKGQDSASYLIGDAGLLLLQWQFGRDPAIADRLYAVVEGNLDHPAREPLWGNAGTAIAAIHMAEASGDSRWSALLSRAVQRLLDTLETDPETGTPIWTQDMYGRRVRYLGGGHGLAGNVYTALRGRALLDPKPVQQLTEAALATLQATALRSEDGCCINWHPMSDAARVVGRLPSVQDCHGAPGMIVRLADAPRTSEWDELLLGAGELTWRAGPLSKGPGLCHGTAGSAIALLELARRSGDDLWLDRARALAAHAAEQVQGQHARYGQGRYGLWTGDLGVACALAACLGGSGGMPTFAYF